MAERESVAETRADSDPADAALILRLEELARRSWPALLETQIDGWLVGSSGAYTRRANCVTPVSAGKLPVEERIDRVEAHCARRDQHPVFKLHPAAQPADLDARLARRGYARRSETIVMTRGLDAVGDSMAPKTSSPAVSDDVKIVPGRLAPEWFKASVEFSTVPETRRADYRAILDRILSTVKTPLFGSVECDGAIRSLALGCLVEETLSLLQVATEPDARGHGLAGLVLSGLLGAAKQRGGTCALLAVEADNAAARRVYQRLGFVERYLYAYREAPERPR